ncbi:nucleoside phosphorylase domain-containing protein [Cladorrhinum sp. PSN259]|nr:nucleoside phosphorylase domain-containing protein [Cladorrhinum sp. PSN259]
MATKALERKDLYTVGWIAALAVEHAAAVAMLDEKHAKPLDFTKPPTDPNSYAWGRIGVHNIVVASLPAGMSGQYAATATATHMISSFPRIRVGLVVGIGGGIPRPDDDIDIRLGDVVVSEPSGTSGGVAQYDAGKAIKGGQFKLRGFLSAPPIAVLNAVAHLKSRHELQEPRIPEILQDMLTRNDTMANPKQNGSSYAYQGKEHDRLFEPTYHHQGGKTCEACDTGREIKRDERYYLDPVIHYGLIASGNVEFNNAAARDKILQRLGDECLCVETQAAGLMNNFPCLVVRGISDYADSHKNDRWQRYAAATAAAYAKELLGVLDGNDVEATKTVLQILPKSMEPFYSQVPAAWANRS